MLQFMGSQRVRHSLDTEQQQFLFQNFSFTCKYSCLIYGISLSLNVYILILLTGRICWQLISSAFTCLKKIYISYSLLKDTSLTIAVQLCKGIDWSLFKLMSTQLLMLPNHFILCHFLLLLPSVFPRISVLSNELALQIMWPKYWSFSFSISPSSEYSQLIFFRMDWLDLLAIQGTLKSLLQHHSSKVSILQSSAFFMVQLSHPYMTTGKTVALTRQTLVRKLMSLLFNILFRLVILFLPRSKHLLISWLHSPSAVILETKKINSVTVSIVAPSICHKVM